VILTCAIILPLIFTIFRDSKVHGTEAQTLDFTHGAAFSVQPATEQDLSYFKDIDGLSAEYENGVIHVRITAQGNVSAEKEYEYDFILRERAAGSGNNELMVYSNLHMGEDESIGKFANQLLLVNAVIILISFLIIGSAYKVHLNKFESDIGVMTSYGAENRQITKMFVIEFVLLFLLSSITAVLVSTATMYILFKLFLEIKAIGNLSWVVFDVNPISVLINLAMLLITGLAVVLLTLRKRFKTTTANLMKTTASGVRIKHYSQKMKLLSSPANSLARLFGKRNKAPFVGSLFVVIPITAVALFMFNYLMINLELVTKPPKNEIVIRYAQLTDEGIGFSPEAIENIKRIPEVKDVYLDYNMPTTKYLVEDERSSGVSTTLLDDKKYTHTTISGYSSIADGTPALAGKYDVAVSKNHAFLKYNVGDKILLLQPPSEHSATSQIELTVTKLLDIEWTDRMVQLYVSDDLYSELTQDEKINIVKIKLSDPTKSPDVTALLSTQFTGVQYTVVDEYSMLKKNQQTSVGMYILALIVLGIMFAFVLVIIGTKLTDYIYSQKAMNKTLHILGAESADLYKAYIHQTIKSALSGIVLSFGVGFALVLAFFNGTGFKIIVTPLTITVQVVIALVIFLSFFVSVSITLKHQLKSL
jgi:predicted lysophospholipase L1 biosynthesis ABC-type transport system permease subunit